jgi:hypothetical protein
MALNKALTFEFVKEASEVGSADAEIEFRTNSELKTRPEKYLTFFIFSLSLDIL